MSHSCVGRPRPSEPWQVGMSSSSGGAHEEPKATGDVIYCIMYTIPRETLCLDTASWPVKRQCGNGQQGNK